MANRHYVYFTYIKTYTLQNGSHRMADEILGTCYLVVNRIKAVSAAADGRLDKQVHELRGLFPAALPDVVLYTTRHTHHPAER